MEKKIKDLEVGQWFACDSAPGRIFEKIKEMQNTRGECMYNCRCVFSFKKNEIGSFSKKSGFWLVEIFPESPHQKRVVKRLYRLYLSKILENKIWRIWFAGGETPDQTKEVAIDADRFFQDEKNEFKKRVLGVEVK